MAGVKKWGPMLGETRKLLLRLAAERGLHSGRAMARELEITPQSVSLLLKGKRVMSSETAVRVCDLLGLDHGDVVFDATLAGAHSNLGRFLGDRLVREDADLEFPLALEMPGDGDARRLNLATGHGTA